MIKVLVLTMGLFLCTVAVADDTTCEQWCHPFWKSQPIEEYVYFGAATADMLTTLDIKHHANQYEETNWILGHHPSDAKVISYFLATDMIHAAITYELVDQGVPKPIIKAWEYVSIGVEVGYASYNLHAGLHFSF